MMVLMLMMLLLNLTFAWSVVALVISIKKTFNFDVCLFVCLKRSNLTTADVQGTVCLVCEPDLSS